MEHIPLRSANISKEDALTVVRLPLGSPPSTAAASNSVINLVFSIETTLDGSITFVIETRTPRGAETQIIADLDPGKILRAVAVGSDRALTVVDDLEVGTEPQGLSIRSNGRTLVLATTPPGAPLTFVTFDGGAF